MNGYGLLEKRVAKALDAAPGIRRLVKNVYQRLNYMRHFEADFQYELYAPAKLLTPYRWAGAEETPGPLFFGYYDKPPWSRDMEYLAFHRMNGADAADIAVFCKRTGEVGTVARSRVFNVQQGSMLQWLPGNRLIFNDIDANRLVSRIVSLDGEQTVLPWPVQTVHPGGTRALTLNYKRLDRLRPEYGYPLPVTNYAPDLPDREDGIWALDLERQASGLIITIERLRGLEPRPEMEGSEHKVNHIMYSPSGSRFVFMHRWIGPQGKFSRLYVCGAQGDGLKLLLDDRMVSHYQWRDDDHLLAWARTAADGDRYYEINVATGKYTIVGKGELDRLGDGHPSYSPDRRWIVTDTYPDKARQRHLLLYDRMTGRSIPVGRFFSPWKYDGPCRCDLHPRWSPDGNWLSVDSAHDGVRKTYLIDVSGVVRGGEND
ncbi:MAG TPA: hypothetical protein VMS09_10495 [Paenibacillus sp.]|uniref:hypothetical protein n=1 Tax=Paenibacillus sp. TaxID=58172 RepID=UPI002C63D45C|nr:hypothetical protein [Paenibacillus sp.]HUC92443.1 hypothetical protein [Paenibacillus sp.]